MTPPQIALRIGGTKQRQGGFVPLVSAGVLAGNEGSNMDRATLVTENPSFVIKHAADYVLYMLCDSSVTSFDISTNGVLTIAITIPRQLQLAGRRSPYDLLMQVYRLFQQTCMNQQSDGHYAFKPDTPDSEPFRQLLQQWPVEQRHAGYVEMAAQGLTAIICLPEGKMSAFFADSMYPELSAYKEVEIGSHCQAMMTPGLELLQVPRPHHYRVIQNGSDTGNVLTQPDDTFRSTLESTADMEYDRVEFTLEQLLNAADGTCCNGQVRLVQARDEISVTVKGRQKKVDLYLSIKPKASFADEYTADDEQRVMDLINSGQLVLKVGQRNMVDFLIEPGHFAVPASMMRGAADIEPTPPRIGDYAFNIIRRQDKLTLVVDKMRKLAATSPMPSNHNRVSEPNHKHRHQSQDIMPSDSPLDDENDGRDSEAAREQARKKRRNILMIVAGAVVLVLLSVGLTLLFTRGNQAIVTTEEVPAMQTQQEDTDARAKADSLEQLRLDSLREADSLRKAGQKAAEEAKMAAEEAQKKAEQLKAEQQKKADKQEQERQQKAQQRVKMLERVNARNFADIQRAPGWKMLTKDEQRAVEALFYGYDSKQYSATQKALVKQKLKAHGDFESFEQIISFVDQLKSEIVL